MSRVEYIEQPRCSRCGKPIRYEEQEYCHDCERASFSYEQGRSVWMHHGLVKKSVYQFKYHNKRVYAKTYAREWLIHNTKQLERWKPDVIIPVPLHWRRYRKRGYNQAEVLAKEVGALTGIPVDTTLVQRKRYTRPQKKLGRNQRSRNLKDAFFLSAQVPETWKRVLIVDDIYTTGSTIDAIAKILKEKGIRKVWFLTISIGQGF